MADDKYTFEQARIRLEEIAVEVRKKDTSLEKSLDLLEEGVRLANICTELVDHTDVGATVTAPRPDGAVGGEDAPAGSLGGAAEGADAGPAEETGDDAEAPTAASDGLDADVDGFDDADDDVGEPADAGSDQ